MPVSLTSPGLIECAPGNVVTIAGAGFGASASAALGGQLVIHDGNTPPTYDGSVDLHATSTDLALTFTVPDGVTSGTVTITATDLTTVTIPMRVVSQYAQASEYIGQGVDLGDLATGELDVILRSASAYVDSYCAAGSTNYPGFRLNQSVELHRWRPKPKWPPRFWPWRSPIVSLDSLVFLTSNNIRTRFDVSTAQSDVFVNTDLGYTEMLAYAFGNYVLLAAMQTIGYSANVVEIGYTSGYAMVDYPAGIRQATIMIATEMLAQRGIQADGMGGFTRVRTGQTQYDRRNEPFAMPEPAKDLLRPYISRRLA